MCALQIKQVLDLSCTATHHSVGKNALRHLVCCCSLLIAMSFWVNEYLSTVMSCLGHSCAALKLLTFKEENREDNS